MYNSSQTHIDFIIHNKQMVIFNALNANNLYYVKLTE